MFFRCLKFSALSLSLCLFTKGWSQQKTININNPVNQTIIEIDLPDTLIMRKKTLLIFFALPNGNSIAWTRGKKMQGGDDWHFDIQHIAAQTAYLRQVMSGHNIIVAYMTNGLKSWPAWKRQAADGPGEIRRIVDSVTGMFSRYRPEIMLNSHSGGGSFIFGYLDAVNTIPDQVSRIAFIDSDYGFEDSLHTSKLAVWLQSSRKHSLTVLAYNDSVVIFNGKPLVSPHGGTWWRTQWMQRSLARYFPFKSREDTVFRNYSSLSGRIDIRLKTNSEGNIYHTEQVARNGFIHTVVSGTKYEARAKYAYWGEWVYGDYIK
jgi:hypothetical protein